LDNILGKRSFDILGDSMKILLVEPEYYSRFPPLGLLKLSAYHKSKGDAVHLVRGCVQAPFYPDRIYVTSLFTWAWRPVWRAVRYYKEIYPEAEVWLGGLYASLMPEHAAKSGADVVFRGVIEDVEDLMPDYEILETSERWKKWDGSIIFTSRGCNNRCPYCAVWRIEGPLNSAKRSIKHLVYPKHNRIILLDNNFLQNPYWRDICDELEELGKYVDFNQGLDARLITSRVANRLSKLKLDSGGGIKVRLGYDSSSLRSYVEKAIKYLNSAGINGRRIMVYVLFNYNDDPEDFFNRVRDVLNWGAVAYPMRYEPLDALEKNSYISPKWTREEIEMVQKARRVIGYGGAFPPYEGILKKFNSAHDFHEAFSLRPPKRKKSKGE
jgi:radical SAM superfamily enzyme YgiQ (UPF0313 family)